MPSLLQPVRKGAGEAGLMPDGAAIKSALEVVNSPEGLDYLNEQAQESGVLTQELQADIATRAGVASRMREFFTGGDIMGGAEPPTPFVALQMAYSANSKAELQTVVPANQEIDLHYNIQEDGTMLRAYILNGKLLNDKNAQEHKIMDRLDTMVKTWMARQSIFYLEGKLYAANAKGEIQQDSEGANIAVNAGEFDSKMRDVNTGFAAFMNENEFNNVNAAAINTTKRMAQPAEDSVSEKETDLATAAQNQRAEQQEPEKSETPDPTQQATPVDHKDEHADAEKADVQPEESEIKQSKR